MLATDERNRAGPSRVLGASVESEDAIVENSL
jgi:hypothetical protein